MPQRLLPFLTLSLIALLILYPPLKYAHADSGQAGLHTTIDGYNLDLVFPNGLPKAGPNTALVRILDAGGQPISNATVQVAPVAVQSVAANDHGHAQSGHADTSAGPVADSHTGANAIGHTDAAPADHADTRVNNAAAPHADAASDDHGHAGDDQHVDIIMTQMESGTEAGTYTSVLHFEAAGAWQVRVQFDAAGVDHTARFAVMVAEPARDWSVLGAFGSANVLIIVAAGVMKRRLRAAGKDTRRATATVGEK